MFELPKTKKKIKNREKGIKGRKRGRSEKRGSARDSLKDRQVLKPQIPCASLF